MKLLSHAAHSGIKFTLICFDILVAFASISLLIPENVVPKLISVPLSDCVAQTAFRILVLGIMSSLVCDLYINAHQIR